jgi:ribose transport system substrate-binding protein
MSYCLARKHAVSAGETREAAMSLKARGASSTLLAMMLVLTACSSGPAKTQEPKAVGAGGPEAKASCSDVKFNGGKPTIAYMPPATEFPYYIAIGEGIKAKAPQLGASTFMLAPQSGSDIEGQMGMIQDVLTRNVDAIILSTHDEQAAAPLVKQALDARIAVVIVNSDIADFPTPVNGVVGYKQRKGTQKIGDYALGLVDGRDMQIGVIEGLPGYHSKERVGGFLDAIKGKSNMHVVQSLVGDWNVEGGNRAAQDMLQAHPEITMIFAANDYMAIGANKAADALGKDIIILGNDGDTQALEEISAGDWNGTVMTHPFQMGETVLQVTMDCLNKKFNGFFKEIPTEVIHTKEQAVAFLCHPESMYPKPSKPYPCS